MVYATSRAFGRRWPVETQVLAIDPAAYSVDLRTTLPLGIAVQNSIRCVALDVQSTRVTFG